jgi:putative transcriptional regulator
VIALVKVLVGGLALVAALQLSPAAASEPPTADIATEAVLLVAHPDFRDPLWRQTVLLAAPLPGGGHVGVIINRPTPVSLGTLFPRHAPSQKVAAPVYFGGPFSADTLVAVVRSKASPGAGSFAVAPELFLAVEAGTIDRVIEDRPEAARYYMGLVFWRPGELDNELARGLWSVRGADARIVFRGNTERLWNELSGVKQGVRVRAGPSLPRSPGS